MLLLLPISPNWLKQECFWCHTIVGGGFNLQSFHSTQRLIGSIFSRSPTPLGINVRSVRNGQGHNPKHDKKYGDSFLEISCPLAQKTFRTTISILLLYVFLLTSYGPCQKEYNNDFSIRRECYCDFTCRVGTSSH